MLMKPVQTSVFGKIFQRTAKKSAPGKRAREGRELIIPLPNEFSKKFRLIVSLMPFKICWSRKPERDGR